MWSRLELVGALGALLGEGALGVGFGLLRKGLSQAGINSSVSLSISPGKSISSASRLSFSAMADFGLEMLPLFSSLLVVPSSGGSVVLFSCALFGMIGGLSARASRFELSLSDDRVKESSSALIDLGWVGLECVDLDDLDERDAFGDFDFLFLFLRPLFFGLCFAILRVIAG